MGIVANPEARREAYIKHHGHDPVSDAAVDTWWRVRAQAVSSYDNASFADTGAVPAWEVQTPYEAAVDEAVDNLQHDDARPFRQEEGNVFATTPPAQPDTLKNDGHDALNTPERVAEVDERSAKETPAAVVAPKPARQARKPKPAVPTIVLPTAS